MRGELKDRGRKNKRKIEKIYIREREREKQINRKISRIMKIQRGKNKKTERECE